MENMLKDFRIIAYIAGDSSRVADTDCLKYHKIDKWKLFTFIIRISGF